MGWNEEYWVGLEWDGFDWDGTERNGPDWDGMGRIGMDWGEMDLDGTDEHGPDWIGMQWGETDWNGLDRNGLTRELDRMEPRSGQLWSGWNVLVGLRRIGSDQGYLSRYVARCPEDENPGFFPKLVERSGAQRVLRFFLGA